MAGWNNITRPARRDFKVHQEVNAEFLKKEFDKVKGGGGGTPGPNTVGTDQIIDGAVEMEDLNDSVKEKIQKVYDEDDETLHMDFEEADVNNSEVGQGGGEDSDDDEAGFDTGAENGDEDI